MDEQSSKCFDSRNKRKTELANFESSNCAAKLFKTNINSAKGSAKRGGGITTEDQLFSNDLLLRNIFKYSNFQDLKQCRQVNRLWKLEATKILRKSFATEAIELKGNKVDFADEENSDIKSGSSVLKFHHLVDRSIAFPCNNFIFPNQNFTKNVRNFFTLHGSLVKYLQFRGCNKITADDLLLFASKHLPNLEVLVFTTKIFENSKPKRGFDNLELRKLHTLYFIDFIIKIPLEFLQVVKKMSPNLKRFCMDIPWPQSYSRILNNLIHANLISVLKNIHIILSRLSLSTYERLLKHTLNIRVIDFVWFQKSLRAEDLPRAGKLLTKFLQKCSQTLTSVGFYFGIRTIPNFCFPILPNVSTLNFIDEESDLDMLYETSLFPTTFLDFAQIFPKLRKLVIPLKKSYEEQFSTIFDKSTAPLHSVEILDLSVGNSNTILTRNMNHLCKLFPKLKKAKFNLILEPAFESVWKFQFLQKLQISLCIKDEEEDESFPYWDSIFTGFCREIVKDLCGRLPEDLNLSATEINALRVKPSLVDLKHLTKLSISLVDENGCIIYEGDDGDYDYFSDVESGDILLFSSEVNGPVLQHQERIVISHVARMFAFEMCPQLKSNVVIMFDEDDFFHMPTTYKT